MIIGVLKSIVFMIVIYIAMISLRYVIRFVYFLKKKSLHEKKKESAKDNDITISLNMLQCEKCKIYISKSEAYIYKGKIFCKQEHSIE